MFPFHCSSQTCRQVQHLAEEPTDSHRPTEADPPCVDLSRCCSLHQSSSSAPTPQEEGETV